MLEKYFFLLLQLFGWRPRIGFWSDWYLKIFPNPFPKASLLSDNPVGVRKTNWKADHYWSGFEPVIQVISAIYYFTNLGFWMFWSILTKHKGGSAFLILVHKYLEFVQTSYRGFYTLPKGQEKCNSRDASLTTTQLTNIISWFPSKCIQLKIS